MVHLGTESRTIPDYTEIIEMNYSRDMSRCLVECLSQWLRRADKVDSREELPGTHCQLLYDQLVRLL